MVFSGAGDSEFGRAGPGGDQAVAEVHGAFGACEALIASFELSEEGA